MSAINRAALKEHLWPGIIEFFGMEYQDYPEQFGYLFDTRKSTKAREDFVAETGFGMAPQKDPGAPIMFDEAADAWKGSVEMLAYALGFVITREAVDDDQYFDLVPKYTRALKRSMKITKEVRAAAYVDGLFDVSLSGDGVAGCSASHPLKNGGTFSNVASASSDLNETSLEAAIIQIADWVDDRGLRISVQPKSLTVPNGLQFTAERLMKTTTGRPGTDTHDVSAIHTMGAIPGGYKLNNYLTDPRAWFLTNNTPSGEGLVHFDRTPLDLQDGDGSENQVVKVMAYERYAFVLMNPRGVFGCSGSPV